ncbi:MAG: hypothetical protein ACJAYG_000831 [Oceanicoccus sp.]|jgi:hypothetical protein
MYKVIILAAAGRVSSQLIAELVRHITIAILKGLATTPLLKRH